MKAFKRRERRYWRQAEQLFSPGSRVLFLLQSRPSVGSKHRRRQAWGRVLRRDPCAYCGGPGGTVDHVTPLARGGLRKAVQNLTGCCDECNGAKADRKMLEFLLTRTVQL